MPNGLKLNDIYDGWRRTMRALPIVLIAIAVAVTGLTVTSLLPSLENPALAQKSKPSKKPRTARTYEPQRTDFSHQQCSVKDPCSTRNQW